MVVKFVMRLYQNYEYNKEYKTVFSYTHKRKKKH